MNGSRLVLLIAVILFVIAALEAITGSKLVVSWDAFVAAGLAFFAAAGLV
jgi:hypothetical protein